jgi:hypothetical protein
VERDKTAITATKLTIFMLPPSLEDPRNVQNV